MAASGVFVGVAVSDVAGLTHLGHVETEVTGLRDLIASSFDGDPLLNPSTDTVRTRLRAVKKAGLDGSAAVVALWSGHGVPSVNGGLRLLAADSDADESDGLSPADFVAPLALSGASQLLLIVDTCYSGAALDASKVAQAVLSARPPDADHVWIGVLASSSEATTARDGVFAPVLTRLLRDGPKDQTLRLRWSVHSERVRGDDLADAVLKEWDPAEGQQPQFLSFGSAWPILANPLWRPDAPAQVVEHLLRAARGGEDGDRSWFTGRRHEVDEVVRWVRDPTPGVRVVTGLSGTGKSAIVGRVVSLSVQGERERLLGQDPDLFDHYGDPGMQSVAAHAHARALTPNRLAQVLDEGLVSSGVLDRAEAPRNAAELAGALERRATAAGDGWSPPVVVVDGLDESRAEAFPIAGDVLNRIAGWASVVVATRNLPADDEQKPDLLATLSPVATMDISAGEMVDSGREAMRAYVVKRLTGVAPEMDADAVAEYFSAKVAATHDDPFLLARLMTSQLRAHPVDTHARGWRSRLTKSVENALVQDLAQVGTPHHRTDPTASAGLAEGLLTALVWGFGAGLPEDEWLEIAAVTTCAGLQPPVGRDDISWLLDQLGRYVVQDGENGEAVYRLAHQTLADELRRRLQAENPDLTAHRVAIAEALGRRYRRLMESGLPATALGYLWRYFWRHAALAGREGLALLEALATDFPVLRGDTGLALQVASDVAATRGEPTEGLDLARRAVDLLRSLVAQDRAYEGNLAGALTRLGIRLAEADHPHDAIAPTEEAVDLRERQVADDPSFTPDLAVALANLGNRYAAVGRRDEAIAPTEEAVRLWTIQATANPRYQPDLAGALSELGVRYAEMGRYEAALAPTEKAVQLRRQQARESPRLTPDLAVGLNNLGLRLADVGRRDEAIASAEEAVGLLDDGEADHSPHAERLAMALNNLGICYADVGRYADAVPVAERAVGLSRRLSDRNAVYLPDLAKAETNLGAWYSELGRTSDALAATEDAVDRYRRLARGNPQFEPDLCSALTNLGVQYGRAGRYTDALAPGEQAVQLYQALAPMNPRYGPSLAMALNSLAVQYSRTGRSADAVILTEEAARLRGLHIGEHRWLEPDRAVVLTNLAVRYAEVGRTSDALVFAQKAVGLWRELVPVSATLASQLASALTSLGDRYVEAGRPADAVGPMEDAVDVWRTVAGSNPEYSSTLAADLCKLGARYRDVGRSDDAVTSTEQGVQGYWDLAAADVSFAANHAAGLVNLGIAYAEAGRHHEALAAAGEAVDRLIPLTAEDPALAVNLALALTSLAARCTEMAEPAGAAASAWRRAVEETPNEVAAYLLACRATRPDADPDDAAEWLRQALVMADLSEGMTAQLHSAARTLRARAETAVDGCLGSSAGGLPEWLTLDPARLELARTWVSAPTFAAERDVLRTHPELLDPDNDLAVDEVFLALTRTEQDRLRDLRSAAREMGADIAYRPLVLPELVKAFVIAGLEGQAALLTERREDLLDPDVRAQIDGLPIDSGADRATALLDLAAGPYLDYAMDALQHPEHMTELLKDASAEADGSAALDALARLARTSDEPEQQARGSLFLALARHLADDLSGRDEALSDLRDLDPDGLPAWAAELGALAARQPAAAQLIQPLLHQPN